MRSPTRPSILLTLAGVTAVAFMACGDNGGGGDGGIGNGVCPGNVNVDPTSATDLAALTTSRLAVGTHAITAIYGGDANFAASQSGPRSTAEWVAAARSGSMSAPAEPRDEEAGGVVAVGQGEDESVRAGAGACRRGQLTGEVVDGEVGMGGEKLGYHVLVLRARNGAGRVDKHAARTKSVRCGTKDG